MQSHLRTLPALGEAKPPPRYPTAPQKEREQGHELCKLRAPLTVELLDLVEQEDGEQQVDDQCGGGCRVPDDRVPWEKEKLLTDERKTRTERRLARGGAGLWWEGGQGLWTGGPAAC